MIAFHSDGLKAN